MKLVTLAGVIAGSFATSTAALAGGCPADQQKANVRAAVDAVLAGRPVDPDQHPSIGCGIKWVRLS